MRSICRIHHEPQAGILTRTRSQGPRREAQRAVFAPSDVIVQFGFHDGMSEQSNDATITGFHLASELAHTELAFATLTEADRVDHRPTPPPPPSLLPDFAHLPNHT